MLVRKTAPFRATLRAASSVLLSFAHRPPMKSGRRIVGADSSDAASDELILHCCCPNKDSNETMGQDQVMSCSCLTWVKVAILLPCSKKEASHAMEMLILGPGRGHLHACGVPRQEQIRPLDIPTYVCVASRSMTGGWVPTVGDDGSATRQPGSGSSESGCS